MTHTQNVPPPTCAKCGQPAQWRILDQRAFINCATCADMDTGIVEGANDIAAWNNALAAWNALQLLNQRPT